MFCDAPSTPSSPMSSSVEASTTPTRERSCTKDESGVTDCARMAGGKSTIPIKIFRFFILNMEKKRLSSGFFAARGQTQKRFFFI